MTCCLIIGVGATVSWVLLLLLKVAPPPLSLPASTVTSPVLTSGSLESPDSLCFYAPSSLWHGPIFPHKHLNKNSWPLSKSFHNLIMLRDRCCEFIIIQQWTLLMITTDHYGVWHLISADQKMLNQCNRHTSHPHSCPSWKETGKRQIRDKEKDRVLKRPNICYIIKKQGIEGYQIWHSDRSPPQPLRPLRPLTIKKIKSILQT